MEYSYKFRIYPTKEQRTLMNKTFGCCRFVYNHYLAKRKTTYRETGKSLSFSDCCKDLTSLKKQYDWLNEVDATALQASLGDLDRAYKNFFRGLKTNHHVGHPKFKAKRGNEQSFQAKNNHGTVAIVGSTIRLPKIGYVSCRVSKKVAGRILSATVQHSCSGKYFVAVNCTDVDIKPLPSTGTSVGIDLGLKELAITSDGAKFDNPKAYAKNQKKLARLQRRLSRKAKGSRNRKKARIKVARLLEHIANQRQDTIQKMTTQLVKCSDILCIEDLSSKNMVRNRKLAKSISDASWYEIRRQLAYKCLWYQKKLVIIDRFYPSSQTCHVCGTKNPETRDLGVRFWVCPCCGTFHDRDINAAQNILSEGLCKIGLSA